MTAMRLSASVMLGRLSDTVVVAVIC